MSNKPKNVKIHPDNIISDKEYGYNSLVKGAIRRGYKHAGSLKLKTLKQIFK